MPGEVRSAMSVLDIFAWIVLVVRVRLYDDAFARSLPAGSTGDAAIFTDHVKPAHLIRKVILRQIAITNYVNPF